MSKEPRLRLSARPERSSTGARLTIKLYPTQRTLMESLPSLLDNTPTVHRSLCWTSILSSLWLLDFAEEQSPTPQES